MCLEALAFLGAHSSKGRAALSATKLDSGIARACVLTIHIFGQFLLAVQIICQLLYHHVFVSDFSLHLVDSFNEGVVMDWVCGSLLDEILHHIAESQAFFMINLDLLL